MTVPNPHPGEFWLTAGGETIYVERYDRYLRQLVCIDQNGVETLRDEQGRWIFNIPTQHDLTEFVPNCSSFTFYKERVGPHQ